MDSAAMTRGHRSAQLLRPESRAVASGMTWCRKTEATIMWFDTLLRSGKSKRTVLLKRKDMPNFCEVVSTRVGERLSEPRVDDTGAFYLVRERRSHGELVRIDCLSGRRRVLRISQAKRRMLTVAAATARAIYCIAVAPAPRANSKDKTYLLRIDTRSHATTEVLTIPGVHAAAEV